MIIPQAVFDELQSQASNHKQQGFVGLEQIEKLNKLSEDSGVKILLKGSHPDINDIKFASSGRIDALIIDIAKQNDAILYTSDKVQHLVAKAEDVQTVFLKPKIVFEKLEFLKFFDSTTMSIHLKENQFPLAKRGKPGEFLLTQINDEVLTRDYLKMISSQILSATNISDSSTVEISKTGASVIQHDDYRIAITYPPFSESYEITIVHPTVQLSLNDYSISESLMQRLTCLLYTSDAADE